MINPLASSGPSSMIPAGERQETDALPPDTGERPKVGIGRAILIQPRFCVTASLKDPALDDPHRE